MPLFSQIVSRISPSFLRSLRLNVFLSLPRIVAALPKSGTVLEVGCGYGHVTSRLAELRPDLQFVGIDPDTDAILRAQKMWPRPNLRFLAVSLENVTERFDLVLLLHVIHHLPAAYEKEILANSARALNAGGELVIEEMRHGQCGFGIFLDTHVSHCPPDVRSDEQLKTALAPCFETLKWEDFRKAFIGRVLIHARKLN